MCTHAGMVANFLIHNIQHGIYHASKSHPLADKCAHVARTGAVWGRGYYRTRVVSLLVASFQ